MRNRVALERSMLMGHRTMVIRLLTRGYTARYVNVWLRHVADGNYCVVTVHRHREGDARCREADARWRASASAGRKSAA